jgi:predicted RNA-binding Zn-ribbon protein involved in translation (DUF1610 family)
LASPLLYGAAALLVVIVAVFVVPMLYARGKWLKCPDCGEVFKAPATDQRSLGVGVSPPYLGKVKCPKCGQVRSRRDYIKASPPQQGTT